MTQLVDTFKHVDYLWDEAKAASMAGDEVALLLYRSNILGADLRITNYGGGNTSCKTIENGCRHIALALKQQKCVPANSFC